MDALEIINTIKARAENVAYGSFIYNWSLAETPPERLVVKPADPWKGDAQRAQQLLDAAGVGERTGAQWFEDWWDLSAAPAAEQDLMNGFVWLRDLRSLGGAVAREQGRLMIETWIARNKNWNAQSWRADILGQRISMWIAHYEFFCAGGDDDFQEAFMASLVKQARHLYNAAGDMREIAYFDALKGLLYAGLALEGRGAWANYAIDALGRAIDRQILDDGGHASRSPAVALRVLQVLADMKAALYAADREVPEFLEETIQNMSAVVRFFRHGDRRMALFHGAQEGENTAIDSILAQAGARGKAKYSLPYSGFERASLGRSLLLLDVGRSPEGIFDDIAHASPLAFEFSYGNARIFTSCGAHPHSEDWNEALRFTAAHNTATLDYRNACEIRKDGHFGRKVTEFSLSRQESGDAVLLEASHNGYVPLNGITHKRRLYLGQEGHDLRGEDDFIAKSSLSRDVEIALRFHIHPSVKISVDTESGDALLTVPGGTIWRFIVSAGELLIEDSLYMGRGETPQKTRQIAIYGAMNESFAQVKWRLQLEN